MLLGRPSTVVTRQFIRLPVTAFYIIFLVSNMVDCRSRINPRLTILTDKNGYLVDEPQDGAYVPLSLIHISEPTRQEAISYAVFCLKKKKK